MKNKKALVTIGILILVGSYIIGINILKENKNSINITKQESKKITKNIIAAYVIQDDGTYKEVKEMPQSGYQINSEKSICSNEAKISGIAPNIIINNLTKKGTSCYLYYDKYVPTASETIINLYKQNNKISNERSKEISLTTEMENDKLYSAEDDFGISYVYAGTNPNNYLKFAGFWWRIIRINGNGSFRLIYNGKIGDNENTIPTENDDLIISKRNFNEKEDDNAYVGYMYGTPNSNTYDETHNNINPSSVMGNFDGTEIGTLNWWFKNNIENNISYYSKIDKNSIFCNDRSPVIGAYKDEKYGVLAYGQNATAYGPVGRLLYNSNWKTNATPSLKCSKINDTFTTKDSIYGNKKLYYPIGLINSDEAVLAGAFGGTARDMWLIIGDPYWTMSPYNYNNITMVFAVSNKNISISAPSTASYNYGVRPVINLRSDITFSSGDGTLDNPYIVAN